MYSTKIWAILPEWQNVLSQHVNGKRNKSAIIKNITKFLASPFLQYSSWNLDSKKLYVKAPVRIQVQSHKETIVEFMRSELLADDTEQFIEKIMEDYLRYRDNFEIYIQTMISQVLDPSFFLEITREKGE